MRRGFLVLAAVLAFETNALAQTTFASITGIVTDPNGSIVPGATISATRIANNYKYTVHANETGYYTIAQLLEGEYAVRVESAGFKVYSVPGLRLADQQSLRLDVRLELGSISTEIEVKATGAVIETESARIGDVKSENVLKDMPLNTRSLAAFIGQNPGVFTAAGAGATATRRFSGSRNDQSDMTVDGVSVGNYRDGTQLMNLVGYIESFQEVRVDSGNNGAEFGALGQVTVVSKGGTNIVHGSAFDYYQTPLFFARNPFALERVSNITHWPGASIGGPIFVPHIYNGKNKSFFFFSFETSRGSMIRNTLNPTVPLASWRNGDFSGLSPSTVIRDPFNGNLPFANNAIPPAEVNPVSQKIQSQYYPLPNFGNTSVFSSQNFRMTAIRPYDPATYWTTRLDHRFTGRDFLFGRFTWGRSYNRTWDDNLPTIGLTFDTDETQAANVSYSHSFRSNLLNELRWGVAYNDEPRGGATNGPQMVQQLGLQGLAPNLPDIDGLLNVNWNGLGLTNLVQNVWRHPAFKIYNHQFQEQLSWFRGRHNLKFGATITRVTYANWQAPANLFGNVTFSNRFTGQPYADFLLGIPTTAARSFPNQIDRQLHWNYDFFATDTFRILPKLTLDLGLRYELHTLPEARDGRAAIFDIASGAIVVPDSSLNQVSPLLPKSYVNVVGASAVGLPSGLMYTDRNNVAPRIGLAWRPLGNNTVIRSGFGIYYDIVPNQPTMNGVPFALDEPTYTNPTTNPNVIFPLVFPLGSSAGPSTITLPSAVDPHLVMSYSLQYSFTIEHQQGTNAFRISYVGLGSRKGPYGRNINQPMPSAALYVNKPRLFPQYPAVVYLSNGAGHQYNAVTVEAKRRGIRGLTYQLSYTLARDIGDLENMPASAPVTGEDAYNLKRERAVWLDIPTQRVNGNASWSLPIGKGKRLLPNAGRALDLLVGNWSLSAIYTYHSGHFLTPTWTGPDPTGTAYTTSATPASVTIRPNLLHDPNANAPHTVKQWFDTTAFAPPTGGYFGSAAKGVIKGPHLSTVDAGLFKSIPLRERLMLRWEITGVNIFNHPNYSDPAASALNITTVGQAGVLSAVGGVSTLDPSGARALRMGLRVEF